jgi:NAD-dependent deacetylase
MKKIVVLTGAGISAESGISTFRDSDGLWENYDVRDVASPEGWAKNPKLVLEFYNQRRRGVQKSVPNAAHKAIAKLDQHYEVLIITQNIDDLHERGGSKNIMHIHGEILKVRSVTVPTEIMHWTDDIKLGDTCRFGGQLRPHIVWFGEDVTLINKAYHEMKNADYVIVVGSSMQVYPAAGLVSEAPRGTKIWFIDPRPSLNFELKNSKNLTVVEENATLGVPLVVDLLIEMAEDLKN